MAEFLACLADRGRIHNWHVGRRIRPQDRVIERLVPCLQIRQHEVLQQIVLETGDLIVSARDLQLKRKHGRRQQTFETESTALCLRECGTFVETRVVQPIVTGKLLRSHFGWCVHCVCSICTISKVSAASIPEWMSAAALTVPAASAAPVPSPSPIPRSKSGGRPTFSAS